ncbi:MAG TPA: hypothetical protein V6C58_16865, partial [Allocoleopsis sp.]
RGPGREIQFSPSTADLGPIINITANNCSLKGFIVRSHANCLTETAITVRGKFSKMDKLYVVGPGQTTNGNTCRGVVFEGGDYHELYNMEIEKFGDCALGTDDKSDEHANGSPREISIFGGNFYLNGSHGFHLHGKTGAVLGSTTRYIRILHGANIHDNILQGVHSGSNVHGVLIDDTVLLHGNNSGGEQVLLNGTGHYAGQEFVQQIWDHPISSATTVGSVGEFINKKLLTVAKYLGLK